MPAPQQTNPILRARSEIEQTLRAVGIHPGTWIRTANIATKQPVRSNRRGWF